ncbi:HpcH/HpaI aldolase/citrate lyase family protein [Leptospira noguchii]|uniref:HpcH/HpaI aldolase/citrate lyase family protein n=1 Tax=Leptospira noguchii serovar Autumnalis str. ZUN142 TaxID=1085540 RepID=M6UDF8_9LEPT|nr:aldolase/citrate lyase family protein [Leptospira noguchii]EKR74602.1 HpcH/HpaI aldolase/citrate lyase family protein [Leptospira noguchii str. 2006001870]EMO39114.1 HpcH/HpaI aldolase/citrate lyase family protein [Leptospira noguchii serovar Autumnalis str. ZUN142]EMS81931.1 HpcH/HpaI aldolase/citrate lyase family protein [Leptospira noguchii str. Hook]UOG43240.1 aldolase/citrate lyase family protein [Leptospira noguchii]
MSKLTHPREALFEGEKPFPIIPACEHFAGSEKLITKALELQNKLGGLFDITMDCEDGAQTGKEKEHAELIVRLQNSELNKHKMSGVRIHDYTNPFWKQDVDIIVPGAGEKIAYITIPKPTRAAQVEEMIAYIQKTAQKAGIKREIPIHVLIETNGALQEVEKIAALPWLQVLDFGLMDFISGHHGAIPASCMKSPGQFEHELLRRGKANLVAAALANGVIPAHNVTLDLKNQYQTYKDAKRAHDDFGFLRMWSIYPTQIQAILDAMAPDYSEVQTSAEILIQAQNAEWGPIQYAGDLHDRATYRYFWEILQKAKLTGISIPEEANKRFFS